MSHESKTLLRYEDIDTSKLTPMMQQYLEEKQKRPDCLLFFRLGDFFELFFDDAVLVSKELGLTLTQRDCGLESKAPMCGVPHHASDSYITRLVDAGYKVAVCEQTEDPALAKGIVKRDVVRVVTPGTLTDPESLDSTRYRFIAAVYQVDRYFGLAFADLSATKFMGTEIMYGASEAKLMDELERMEPAELICNKRFAESDTLKAFLREHRISVTVQPEDSFSPLMKERYPMVQAEPESIWPQAMYSLLNYIESSYFALPEKLNEITAYKLENYMILDQTARRHLEISETIRDRRKKGSLLWALDRCETAMGSRLLRQWLDQPLLNKADILERQKGIAAFKEAFIVRAEIREILSGVYDLERLSGKIALFSANPRDLASIASILEKIPALKTMLERFEEPVIKALGEQLDALEPFTQKLRRMLKDELPIQIKEGGIFREGADPELDELRRASKDGKQWLIQYESGERERTGIKNLKLKYNRVFGYSIEVTRSYAKLVPEHYIRKQTLVNAERYITQELKDMEDRILGAEQKLLNMEYELFVALREEAAEQLAALRQNAAVLALTDLLASLGEVAERENYCAPVICDEPILEIEEGRHPVVEKMLDEGSFVPNDLLLNTDERRLMILTGPNMAGKSTYMRQTALICLMAQAGLFVPAKSARIGICDQIFTRVGASDDLSSGQSTFMVEMNEVARIMRQASSRSLLILDEIGRGTSTWDGMSIAWSVIEHTADKAYLGCRCLFATHYHELTDLADMIEGVFNCHVDIIRDKKDLIFLHKICEGGSDNSYGIDVARLAGVPDPVIERAEAILSMLEQENKGKRLQIRKNNRPIEGQIDLFTAAREWQQSDEIVRALNELDLNLMRPLDALSKLSELQEMARRSGKAGE